MRNFEIKCTYTQQHDTVATFIRQVIELILHLDKHKWVAKEKVVNEYIDADGDLCVNLTFVFTSPGQRFNGKEIGNFIALCAEVCGDSVRIYDGGSGPYPSYKHYRKEAYLKWKAKYFPNGRGAASRIKKEKLNELNQP